MPVRAAASANAAVVVVLPTPPLPATMTTRDAEQKRVSSIHLHATGALAPRRRRVPRRLLCVFVALSAAWIAASANAPGAEAATGDPAAGLRGIEVVQVN